ncbi:MAG: hypothetical protein IT368_13520, partial [Candidatus Hydrogenedentes bacterium]|nr:hypothetical protein [Candidatus Hydrogenedentota bacterium]
MMTHFSLASMLVLCLGIFVLAPPAQAGENRWALAEDGAITWGAKDGEALPEHSDNIEMSGRQVSLILQYGVKKSGGLLLRRHLVWPMLR